MYNKKPIRAIFSIAAMSCIIGYASLAYSKESSTAIAIGAKIGSTGIGLEARTPLAEALYGRLGVNYSGANVESDDKDIKYKAKATFLVVPLMLDYHFNQDSGFRISAGIGYNGTKLKLSGTPKKTITLYGNHYTQEEIGQVKGNLKFGNKIVPIVTIGYDSSFIENGPWSFNAEAGIIYLGKPKLKISSTGGSATAKEQLQKDLKKDADRSIKDAKKYLTVFPVLSIGFKYNI